MCDNQMICDILWEGRILLLSQKLHFKLRRHTNTHAEDETAEETDVSSEAFPRLGVLFMPSPDVRTRLAPDFIRVALTDCQVESGPN